MLLLRLLAHLAARVVRRYRPVVVGITGSVGKTSARTAVTAVLAAAGFRVRGARKNYNNELGLPLTVLGAPAPGRNPAAWLGVLLRGCWLLLVRDARYPTHLVLEYGADHVGDLAALVRIATPNVAVVTTIAPVHLEFFRTVEAVAREKGILVEALPSGGTAILNADDPAVAALAARTHARVWTYGFARSATVRAHDAHIALTSTHDPRGVRWHLAMGTDVTEIVTSGTLGRGAISSVLAGAAVGAALGVDFWIIAKAAAAWVPPPGRMRMLPARGGAVLLDDTYNSSPRAADEALDTLAELRMSIPERRRSTVVLGTMAELGSESEKFHRALGVKVAAINPEQLVTVGEDARTIGESAQRAGLPAVRIHAFASAAETAAWLAPQIASGDIVLVKGSQSVRCERISAALLADPTDAVDLLVRQGADWQDRP